MILVALVVLVLHEPHYVVIAAPFCFGAVGGLETRLGFDLVASWVFSPC
jgi:hypothetical protein